MRPVRQALALVGAAAVVAVAGCGSGSGSDPVTGNLEQLAARVGCAPQVQTDADQLRQAVCEVPAGRFVLATFATDQGQRVWLDDAEDYGGHYLVGARWVAVGGTDVLDTLRGPLGGTTEEGVAHQPAGGAGGDGQMDHDHNG
jgi:hypothetical protein